MPSIGETVIQNLRESDRPCAASTLFRSAHPPRVRYTPTRRFEWESMLRAMKDRGELVAIVLRPGETLWALPNFKICKRCDGHGWVK